MKGLRGRLARARCTIVGEYCKNGCNYLLNIVGNILQAQLAMLPAAPGEHGAICSQRHAVPLARRR